MPAEQRTQVMGSDAHVVVEGPDGLTDRAIARLHELDRRWSRFRPDSEVTRLNERSGQPVVVSMDTRRLVHHALEAWRVTGGSFDPTVLGDVVRAGYDRTFSQVSGRPGSSLLTRGAGGVTLMGASVTLPPGVGFDPGGLGKGLAADLVASQLVRWGASRACVNVGGDVRVTSRSGRPSPVVAGAYRWRVAIDDPTTGEPVAVTELVDGAIATSSVVRRAWGEPGHERHHLIDPRTGKPMETPLATVTVVAARCWQAEALTKAVLLAPAEHRFALVERLGASVLAIARDGTVLTSASWARVQERSAA